MKLIAAYCQQLDSRIGSVPTVSVSDKKAEIGKIFSLGYGY